MENTLYRKFLFIWLGCALSAALLPFGAGVPAQAVSLVSLGFVLYGLYGLREVCARFEKAFFYQVGGIVLMLVAFVLTLVGGDDVEAMSGFLVNMLLLSTMVSGVFSILADYFLFWGMDEIILTRGYVFPARRIRWCFYLALIGAFAAAPFALSTSVVLPTIILLVFSIAQLVLFYRYLQAVKTRENSPLDGE